MNTQPNKFNDPYPRLSRGNSKLGAYITGVNLPAGMTCRADAPCRKGCYAMKGRFIFNSVKTSIQKNLEAYINSPTEYFNLIIARLQIMPYRYFRWHSSGDIVNMEYLYGMVRVAEECPKTEFLCFTKKYELVNEYLANESPFPDNLHIVFSHWGSFPVDNPFELPTSHVRFKKEDELHDNCDIPDDAIQCSGFCGDCVGTEKNCWLLKSGESVVFNQH
ncbi:MAG: hypothetical protein KBT02_00045 [Treponema sp.]|nr:hypothetical protein [Candidatus Treponema caballi]